MKKLVIVLGVMIVILVVFIATLDLNRYKEDIQTAAKNALGYDLEIRGDIAISFSPIGISISDVGLSVPGKKEFVAFKNFGIALELMPLLSKEIKVKYIVVKNLNLNIIKFKDGKTNFAISKAKKTTAKNTTAKNTRETKKDEKKNSELPLVNVTEVRIKNANVTYIDNISNSKASLKNIDVTIKNIVLDSTKKGLESLAFSGKVKILKITYNKYKIHDTALDFNLKNAVANLNSMKYTIFNSLATAKAKIDMSGKIPKVSFEESIPNLKLSNLSKEMFEKELVGGIVNSRAKISFTGADELSAKKTVKGHVLLDGENITIKGYNVDKIVKSYNSLKGGDLNKIGKSFLSSAINNVSKGKNALSDFKGGTTAIKRLYVKIDIANKMAKLSDVAIATLNNRVALRGAVNIIDNSLRNVKIAILDKKGCASYSQSITGSISNPKTDEPKKRKKITVEKVKKVVGMLSTLFGKKKSKAKKNTACKIFYNGVVK